MGRTMTDHERKIIPEIVKGAEKLSDENKLKLLWIAQGILIAEKNGKC